MQDGGAKLQHSITRQVKFVELLRLPCQWPTWGAAVDLKSSIVTTAFGLDQLVRADRHCIRHSVATDNRKL